MPEVIAETSQESPPDTSSDNGCSKMPWILLGPFTCCSSRKRYILVICDRYPEAIPLRTIDADRIAKQLVSFFARVGIPEETLSLTDQGTNFTSAMLQEVYRLLKAFLSLQHALCSSPVLQSPDFSRPFIMQTDASNRGVIAVLSQRDRDGTDCPVAYYSRKLLLREERFSTIEKECLTIKVATDAFCVYLLGSPFIIQTDHCSLKWLDQLIPAFIPVSRV